jgi:hypothetical protein
MCSIFYIFQNSLGSQPMCLALNSDQSLGLVACFQDVLFIDLEEDIEYDIDEHFQI